MSLALALSLGCHACGSLAPSADERPSESGACPAMLDAPTPLPGMHAAHDDVQYWLPLLARQVGDLDAPILTPPDLGALDTRIAHAAHQYDLRASVSRTDVEVTLATRFAQVREKIATHALFDAHGAPLDAHVANALDATRLEPLDATVHMTLASVPVHCTPRDAPYFTSATDRRFDRNQCSHVRAQEPMQVLGRLDGRLLVRTRYTFGFIASRDALGPALDEAALTEAVTGARVRLEAPLVVGDVTLPRDTQVLIDRSTPGRAVVHTPTRRTVSLPSHVSRPVLTRRALLEEAFHYLGQPYGWGGQDGGLDCSNFVMDVLSVFGLHMPRHSADQIESGSFALDVPASLDDAGRARLLDEANRAGVVLIHFPGHIMLYVGRDADGRQTAVHSFAEYVEPCETAAPDGRRETLRRARGVSVTHLEIGRGTSRRAFLERMTKLSVIGHPTASLTPTVPNDAQRAAAPVVARACQVADAPEVFRSPRRPHAGGPLRLMYTHEERGAPVSIALVSSDGRRIDLSVERRGGPPYGFIGTWASAEAGTYTVLVGDGPALHTCETIVVEPERTPFQRPITSARNVWDRHAEALYAVFVEKLFDYPLDDRTWPDLHTLLADAQKNILFDHFTANEESRLRLAPDCADLPVFLRAYFAWKMGMPFGYRSCSRGGEGEPPRCGPLASNLEFLPTDGNPVKDFLDFVNGPVRGAVHSASGRTLPSDENTDLYPVALTRGALRPGTVYADPYGHVMTIVRFVPQTGDAYGMLVAADAQPDATIGMPRFWRGTFLFTPDTRDVGAGFKAFRPVFRSGATRVRAMTNAELSRTREFVPYSTMQYEGSLDDFYDRMDAVIDPSPLDPFAKLVSLVDALEDSVSRRLVSVDNAQAFLATRRATIPMPEGAEIFLTAGPWEDFSTPSRDLRLLIALDAVTGFPDRVARAPERYRIGTSDVDDVLTRLRTRLDTELASRRITYHGTGGREVTITLADVRARARGFEMAYNPNDCPERRWAAPEGSDELAACRARAPEGQRAMMARYRRWFAERRRPAM